MTYDELVEQIKFITTKGNEPNFVLQIPKIIRDACAEVQLRLNVLQAEKTVFGEIPPGANLIQKPFDWLYTVSLSITNPDENNKTYILKRRNYGYVRLIQNNDSIIGIPEFYSNEAEDQFFLFAPIGAPLTNNGVYSYTLRYHILISPLDSTNQQNWLTKTYPALLLQASYYYAFLALRNQTLADYHFEKMKDLANLALQTNLLGKTDENINPKVS
jgi:hypothetical protein